MKPTLLALVLAFAATVGATGCSGPCDELVERVCATVGEAHESCVTARARLESSASTQDRACKRALVTYKAYNKTQE